MFDGARWPEFSNGLSDSDATLTNNVIADNQANTAGSGVYIRASSPRLLHTTLADNNGGDGSGVYITDDGEGYSAVTLTNTILTSHSIGISVTGGNTVTANSIVWYSTPITISKATTAKATTPIQHKGDPAFIDPNSGDYHITADSAARDVGVNANVIVDIDGQPRPISRGYDIGADEFRPTFNTTPLTPSNPDPFDGATDIPLTPTLRWQGSDPDGDLATFIVAFGTENPPPVVVPRTHLTDYVPSTLAPAITYYWAITVTDGISTVVGPTWRFTTTDEQFIFLPLILKNGS